MSFNFSQKPGTVKKYKKLALDVSVCVPLQGGNGEEHGAGEEDDGAGEVEAGVIVSDGVVQST